MADPEWDIHKSEIKRLYLTEKKSLKRVIQIMATSHGFSKRDWQYEKKIKEWGYRKYRMGAKQWEYIDHRISKIKMRNELSSAQFLGKKKREPEVYVDGILYPPEKVKLGIRRNAYRSTVQRFTSAPSPPTPPGIVVCSPAPSPLQVDIISNLPWLQFSRIARLEEVQGSPKTTNIDQTRAFCHLPTNDNSLTTLPCNLLWNSAGIFGPLPDTGRTSTILSIITPEEYEGQHLHTSRSLCNTDMKDMKDVISVVLFLLSNSLSFRIFGEQGQDIDDPRDLSNFFREDNMIKAIIEVSGLNSPETIKHLLRLGGVTAEIIVEKLFASAVRTRNFQLFVTMLQAGVDPKLTFLGRNVRGHKLMSLTALEFVAARYSQRESVQWARLLLLHNAILGQPGRGSSALELAFMNQNEELVNLLVQKVRQVSPDLIGRCLEATGNLKIARTCLEFCDEIYKGFELSITCTDTRQTGPGTLLGVVCWNRSTIEATVIAEHLLERGANVDAWHIFPAPAHRHKNLVTTPLGLAAARGNVQLMKILLEAGANLRPDGVLGCLSPLVLAVHYKQHFAVELLTKWGAPDENIERKLDFIETTPSYALPNQIEMMMQNEAMRTMVIENGMKRDLMILRAIETDEANLVQMLLETKTLGGATRCCVSNTLGRAIGQGKRDIITLLLNAGAHLELRYVFSIGDLKTAMYLEERGLLHSLLREKGRWILTTAIMAADRALIDFLLENSADRSSSSPPTNFSQLDALLRDHKSPSSSCSSYHYSYGDFVEPGRLCVTPLEAALCRGYFELAKILLRRGAPVKEREINALVWNAINFRHLLVHTFEFLDLVSTTRTLPCAPTALKMAISSGGQLLVRSLLEAGIGVVGTYFVPSDVVDPIILYRLRHRGERSCKLAGWWNWTGENKAHPATFASEYVNLQFSQAQSDSQTLVKMLGPKHRCQSISLLEHAVEKSEKCTFSILLQVDAWTPEDLGKAIVKSLQLDRKDLTPGLLASAAKLYKKGHFCSSLNFGPKEADAQTVNHFISAGCSLDYIFGSPKMALCEAIEYEQMALVDILLRAGVHLDEMVAPTEVSAFFQIAVKQNHHKLMDMLLLAGADVNTPATSRDMGTALQIAVGKENLQLTQWLLEIGANVNGAPWRDSGRTALQAAVLQGNLELVNKLLDIGADVNQSPADSSGATALQLAAIRGYISIAQKLIGRGANINGSRGHHFGRTALEGAAEHGRTDMLQLLLDGGSFLEGEGRRELIRAVKLAVKNERHAISRYLKSFVDWNDSDNECFQKEVFDQEEKDMLGKKA